MEGKLINLTSQNGNDVLTFIGKELEAFTLKMYPNSSSILLMGSNEEERQLYIMFAGGKAYLYQGVPLEILREVAYADSPSKLYMSTRSSNIKAEQVKWHIKTATNEEIVELVAKLRDSK